MHGETMKIYRCSSAWESYESRKYNVWAGCRDSTVSSNKVISSQHLTDLQVK